MKIIRRGVILIIIVAAVFYAGTYLTHRTASATTTQTRAGAANYGIAAGGGLTGDTPTQLNQRLTTMQNLGVGWVRFDFSWASIQPANAITYNWTATDRVVQAATAHHLKVLGIIDNSPAWAQTPGCTTDHCQPANPAAFGIFSGTLAAHYAPMGVHDWEIWNEENTVQFWQPTPNPLAYTLDLKVSDTAIKAADPSAFVLTGGLAPVTTTHGEISATTYLTNLYAFGAQSSFNAVASHPYSYPALPSASASYGPYALHQIMAAHGDSAKPIWITEIGAPTDGPPGQYVSQSQQAATATTAARIYDQPWIGPLFWYSDTDAGTSTTTAQDFFGLVSANGTPKPAYTSFQQVISGSR